MGYHQLEGETDVTKLQRKFFVSLLLLLVCAGAVVGVNRLFAAGTRLSLEPPAAEIPSNLFGMHMHYAATLPPHRTDPPISTLTPWPEVPFSGWRLWDAYVVWPWLEPKKGEWNFEVLDKAVALAEEHGVEVLLPLALSPSWASARPTEGSTYGDGLAAGPEKIEDWRNYVRTVAKRYKGRIHYYEVWNEPNREGVYTGTLDELLSLFQEAYQILKQVDPSNTLVGPSVSNRAGKGVDWLREYLARGGGEYTDVIAYHFYVGADKPPEAMLPLIRSVNEVKANAGLREKPLWNTEAGWPKGKDFSADEAAGYVARAYILNWAAGVPRFYWYAWDNHSWVSLYMTEQADRKTLTPAAIAYEEVQKWLIGSRMTNCQSNLENTWVCQLTREESYRGWIVWNSESSSRFRIPHQWDVQQMRDLAGGKRSLSQDSIEIGPSPLLLEHFNS